MVEDLGSHNIASNGDNSAYELTVVDMVVAVCSGRATTKTARSIALSVADKFRREFSSDEIRVSINRLIEAQIMHAGSGANRFALTAHGACVLAEAQNACLRLLDSHTGIFILGQEAGLFANWSEDQGS